jgi:hypothetical protein
MLAIVICEPIAGGVIAVAHVTVAVVPSPELPLVAINVLGAKLPKLTVTSCVANELLLATDTVPDIDPDKVIVPIREIASIKVGDEI